MPDDIPIEDTTALIPTPDEQDPSPEPDRTWGYQPPQIVSPKWRSIAQNRGTTSFNDKDKARFLKHYALHGRIGQAAAFAKVSRPTILAHRKADPDFDEACQQAWDAWKERVEMTAEKVAILGVDRPIMGGKYKDEVVAYERTYDSKILAMELKRVNPEYREKNELSVTLNAGVLAIPVLPTHKTAEEALAQWDQQQRTEREQRDALAEQQASATNRQLAGPGPAEDE
jgi:hypothetical protein